MASPSKLHLQELIDKCASSSSDQSVVTSATIKSTVVQSTSTTMVTSTSSSFDEAAYASIVSNLNSAVMSSTREEECAELMEYLNRLEARLFDDNGSFSFRKTAAAATTDVYRPSDSNSGRLYSSPASCRFGDASFRSPEVSPRTTSSARSSGVRTMMSDPPRKSASRMASSEHKRTARKLEQSFEVCTSTCSSARRTPKFDLSGSKKSALSSTSSSARDFGSLFGSWGSSFRSSLSIRSSSSGAAVRRSSGGVEFGARADVMPDVSCKPLMLASKGRQRLPVRRIASDIPKKTVPAPNPNPTPTSEVPCPRHFSASLQCVTKDGAVTYNLWLEDTDELLVAKPVPQDVSHDHEVCDKVFAIHSHKCKPKGKSGWKKVSFGKKDKPVVEQIGKMKVMSSVIPEMDVRGGGKHRHFVDSDFVLLEARKTGEAVVPGSPLTSGSERRVSVSSWDATPNESPRCPSSDSSESPKCPASPQASQSFSSSSGTASERRTPSKWLRPRKDADGGSVQDDGETVQNNHSYVEVAAVVTRIPMEIKKKPSPRSTWESRLKRNSNAQESDKNNGMSVTVVLPAGDHGTPGYGLPGPPPLLERWRSGGSCDCGSWDLGCGLVVLGNQHCPKNGDATMSVIFKGLKGQRAALNVAPLYDDDTFSVSFEHPLSKLQAFGGVVAMLHTRSKVPPSVVPCPAPHPQKQPLKVEPHLHEESKKLLPKLRFLQGALTGFPRIRRGYSMGCHPEPLSLVERV